MLAGRCRYHGDRDAVAICMRCSAAICVACTTKLDGVNHCRACLDALRAPDASAAPRRDGNALARAFAVLAVHGALLLVVALVAHFWKSRA